MSRLPRSTQLAPDRPAIPIRTLLRHLPGRCCSAAMVVHGELWLVIDPCKNDATDLSIPATALAGLPPPRQDQQEEGISVPR